MAKDQQATTKTAAENTQTSQKMVPPASTPVNPSTSAKQSESVPSNNEQDAPEKPLPWWERPEWVIVYITAAYTVISALMLAAIKRQADLMERQARTMEGQTEVFERSVRATEESVRIARQNTEMV